MPENAPNPGTTSRSPQELASWIFGTLTLIFLGVAYYFPSNNSNGQWIIIIFTSILAGLLGYFMTGTIAGDAIVNLSSFSKITIQGGGAIFLFIVVLLVGSQFLGKPSLPPESRPPATKKAVVLMDSPLLSYDEDSKKTGRTNSDDITTIISDLGVNIIKENTSLQWERQQEVFEMDPDLIIIHLSCFYSETTPLDSDKKFRDFLEYMAKSRTKFLVYTRGLSQNIDDETRKRFETQITAMNVPHLKDRLTLFTIERETKVAFQDPEIRRRFKLKVRELLN
jgi:hypothetical protein